MTAAVEDVSLPEKIWANSGDSHFLEPEDIWKESLPAQVADRLPRTVRDGDWETVFVDGTSFVRRAPHPKSEVFIEHNSRPPGAWHATERLKDLDAEGVWAEVIYPSLGLWNNLITDPKLLNAAIRVSNDYACSEILRVSPRLVPAAEVSTLDVSDAVAELERCAELGFRLIFLPSAPPPVLGPYNREAWNPLWAAAAAAGMVVGIHIGTDYVDPTQAEGSHVTHRGPGGALMNYAEVSFSGQRCAGHLVASGALDRHPDLKVLVSEGGASWVPFLGDRMNEAYRQHHFFVRPELSLPPKEYFYRQVYASFQHDVSAVQAVTGMGYRNVMFGTDYPHLEGTFGHTQETLHELFAGVPDDVRHRVTVGSFHELFPHVGEPPS